MRSFFAKYKLFGLVMLGISMAFGMLVGFGATALVSIRLGEQRKDEAERVLGNAVVLIVGIALVLVVRNAFGALFVAVLVVWCFATARKASGEIAQLVRSAAHSRDGGRTALIFPLGQLMQMGDRFASIGQIEVAQAKIKIFDSWEKARPWLGL